jgi:hypothetical protein
MTEEKGKTTMVDIAHRGGSTVIAGNIGLGNLEPLMLELIKAVRAITLTVNVPALGPPEIDVHVAAPVVSVAAPEVHVAAPNVTVPNANALPVHDPVIVVKSPDQRLQMVITVAVWLVLVADILSRVGGIHACH